MSKFHGKNDKWKPGTGPRLATQSRGKAKFQVVKKSQVKPGVPTYKAKWVPSRKGGLMADIKVHGRRVFLDTRGPQPKNDGKVWEFVLVAENDKRTVYFAQIVLPANEAGPLRIVIDKSGKMICTNRRPIVTRFRKSKAPVDAELLQYRHASPNDKLEPPDEDDYFDDDYVDDDREDEQDRDDEDEDNRDDDDLFDDVDDVEKTLNPQHQWCFSCGFYDCQCDGTALEMNPVRKYFANRAD